MATKRRRILTILVVMMVILAGGLTRGPLLDDIFERDDEQPDAIPGGRYDPR